MGSTVVFRREELLQGKLRLGKVVMDLSEYATTGLRAVAVGPSGCGKTNCGFVMAESLSAQGWVSVIISPEGEAAELYGKAVSSPEALDERLRKRDKPIVVVDASDASGFVPYGKVIREVADSCRRPLLVVMDEGQIFSASRKRQSGMGEASDLVNDFLQRGRKRALDLFITANRFSASVSREAFQNGNLRFVGAMQDAAAWSSLAPMFRGTGIGFSDLAALSPGEFFVFSRRGVEKIAMQMADKLRAVAPVAVSSRPALPSNFSQWNRALRAIPTARLDALQGGVVDLLGSVAGLSSAQLVSGSRALRDELEARRA